MIDNYVTGSSGFVGKHLLPKLSGKTVTVPHTHIAEFKFRDCQNFYFLSTYGNMAWHEEQSKIYHGNVTDLRKVLERFIYRDLRCASFVFMSTSSVLLPNQTAYSTAKKACEEMLTLSALPYCIVRPFSITGVGEQRQHLIPTLIRSCMEGEQMEFVPDATHDYVDVEDVVSALLILSKVSAKGTFGLGNGIATTNQEVLELVESITGKKANVKVVDQLRDYDSKDWRCMEIGNKYWQPVKTLRQSITEMVEEYKRTH